MVGNAWLRIFCKKLLPFVYYICTIQLQKVAVLKKLRLKMLDFGLIQHCEMNLELFMWWFKRESMPCIDLCVVMRLMREVRLREHVLYCPFQLCPYVQLALFCGCPLCPFHLWSCLNPGQVITASIADIITNYSFKDILRKLAHEKQTGVAPPTYDDNYMGKLSSVSISTLS